MEKYTSAQIADLHGRVNGANVVELADMEGLVKRACGELCSSDEDTDVVGGIGPVRRRLRRRLQFLELLRDAIMEEHVLPEKPKTRLQFE
jgi:hypothetical protein